jgi:hypothetical protein
MSTFSSLQRWRPGHLLAAWSTYWAGLAAVTLGPALGPIMRVTGEDAKGSISAGIANDAFNLTIAEAGTTVWSGHASLTAVVLWVAVPPLLLWIAWMVARPRRHAIGGAGQQGEDVILSEAKDLLLPLPTSNVVEERDRPSRVRRSDSDA